MRNRKRVKEIYDGLVEKFEARDRLHRLLERHYKEYGNIPKKYIAAWNQYQEDKRPWREIKGLEKKLWRTARIMEKNERYNMENRKNKKADKKLNKLLKKDLTETDK